MLPKVQRVKMGQALAGQRARVWADELTVHVTVGGNLIKIARTGIRTAFGRLALTI